MAERPENDGLQGNESGQHDDHADQVADRRDGVPTDDAEAAAGHGEATGGHDESPEGDRGVPEGTARLSRGEDAGRDEVDGVVAADEADSEEATAQVVRLTPKGADEDTAVEDELIDDDEIEEPVVLAELQADDSLLDALGGTDPAVPGESEEAAPSLETLLVSWRREVDAAPIDELVDVDTAAGAIAEGRRTTRRKTLGWRRHLVPVASAAAVLMIMSTGVSLAARDALPGDMLWGVAQVLYSDHARAAQAQEQAKLELQHAQQAWVDGNHAAAEGYLDNAWQYMRDVDPDHGLSSLEATHESLAAEFGKEVAPPDNSSTSVASSEFPTGTSEVPTSTSESVPTETETSVPTSSDDPTESSSYPTETTTSTSEPSSGTSLEDSGFPWPTD